MMVNHMFKSSGRWLCVIQWVISDVIKDSSAFIFTDKRWICATVKMKVKHRNYRTKTTVSHPGRLEWILLRPQATVTYSKNPMFQWLPLFPQISDFCVLDTADPWHFSPNIFQIWEIPNMSQQTCFRQRRLLLCITKHVPPHIYVNLLMKQT